MRFLLPRPLPWLLLLLIPAVTSASTLQEAFELAGPAGGYDRYLVLETGVVYTGGLLVGPSLRPYSDQLVGGPGFDVRIVGNGAILDLQGQQLCISYCQNVLDIDDCIVINGDIRFRGISMGAVSILPTGSVRHVTFFQPHDYGIRLQHAGAGITVERNLVVGAVDTGPDFLHLSGIANVWLPTGTNISAGWNTGSPIILDNWSYHLDEQANLEPLAHFSFL